MENLQDQNSVDIGDVVADLHRQLTERAQEIAMQRAFIKKLQVQLDIERAKSHTLGQALAMADAPAPKPNGEAHGSGSFEPKTA
jgi:hypothetical protein